MDDAELDAMVPALDTNDLLGAWQIVQTTFPMWLTAKHTRPTLNYARVAGADSGVLADRVEYLRHGKPKTIRGIDRQDPTRASKFTWRGHGVLALLTSRWIVVDLDPTAGILAIYFSKTWFTPAGLDIASRDAKPEPAAIEACLARLCVATSLRPHLDQLQRLSR